MYTDRRETQSLNYTVKGQGYGFYSQTRPDNDRSAYIIPVFMGLWTTDVRHVHGLSNVVLPSNEHNVSEILVEVELN